MEHIVLIFYESSKLSHNKTLPKFMENNTFENTIKNGQPGTGTRWIFLTWLKIQSSEFYDKANFCIILVKHI